ncbi:MAG: hypothetical protein QOE35_3029 [Actinomycetota bacterium]|jgi:uncharacterized protein YcnI
MSMKKTLTGALLTVALVLAASPAWAHEEISPPTAQTGKPTFFTLSAANEKAVALNRVTITAPTGTPFGTSTHASSGWKVDRTDTSITWTGGSVAPDTFDTWGFEIEGADQPGTLQYKVTLGFADGKTENVTVPVTVVAAGTTATTISGGKTTATTTAAVTGKGKGKTSSSKRANVALGVGGAALVLSLIALAAALSGRRRSGEARDW